VQITELGWDHAWEGAFPSSENQGLRPARIVREDRGRYRATDADDESVAETTGRLRRFADRPAVGDWVAVRRHGENLTIHAILPRRSRFERKVPGSASRTQVLAANVDVAFIVTGLDDNFSLRRIERYLTLAGTSGARPVVVLSKADLADDLDLRVRQAEGVATDAPVLPVSAVDGTGLGPLAGHLGPGRTGVFLGSSGVGKTTLVNRLLGVDTHATGRVREADSRGRHTTTRRELIVLPEHRGLVIDTPGLREIQLPGGEGLAASFPELEELAANCRFRDCRHEDEPGCAVLEALRDGRLDPDRFESFLEQRREAAYQERRSDDRARRAEEGRWRRITMDMREKKKSRPERR